MASEPGVRPRTLLLAALPLAAAALSAGCSSGSSSGPQAGPPDGPPTVTANGTSCRLSSDSVTAGEVVLRLVSTSTTSVIVSVAARGPGAPAAPAGSSVALSAGASGELRTTLLPGDYDVTCRAGDGASSTVLSVNGESG